MKAKIKIRRISQTKFLGMFTGVHSFKQEIAYLYKWQSQRSKKDEINFL